MTAIQLVICCALGWIVVGILRKTTEDSLAIFFFSVAVIFALWVNGA